MTVSTYIFFVLVKGNKHRNQTSWKTWPNTLQAQTSRQPPHLLLVSKDSGNSGSEWPQKNTAVCRFSQTTRHHVFQTKKRRPFWPSVSKQYEKHINIYIYSINIMSSVFRCIGDSKAPHFLSISPPKNGRSRRVPDFMLSVFLLAQVSSEPQKLRSVHLLNSTDCMPLLELLFSWRLNVWMR